MPSATSFDPSTFFPCFISWEVPFFDRRGQRLGDLSANTIVVLIRDMEPIDIQDVKESKYNSLREYPHLEARLRQRVSPTEVAITFDAILRRDQISLQARIELFQKIAAHFHSIIQFDEIIEEAITDEQFVRNNRGQHPTSAQQDQIHIKSRLISFRPTQRVFVKSANGSPPSSIFFGFDFSLHFYDSFLCE